MNTFFETSWPITAAAGTLLLLSLLSLEDPEAYSLTGGPSAPTWPSCPASPWHQGYPEKKIMSNVFSGAPFIFQRHVQM